MKKLVEATGFNEDWFRAKEHLCAELSGPMGIAMAHSSSSSVRRKGLDNIVGMYVGYKTENGRLTPKPAIVIQVSRKIANSTEIGSEARIPKTFLFDGKEYVTDVEEVGIVLAQGPAVPGDRIYIDGEQFWGTFGCLCAVAEGNGYNLCILSNNHVMANANDTPIDTIITDETTNIARLWHFQQLKLLRNSGNLPPDPGASFHNLVDGALAHTGVTNPLVVSPGRDPVGQQKGSPFTNMAVKKYGARTGFTAGTIVGMGANVWAGYKPNAMGLPTAVGYFVNQLVIKDRNGGIFSDRGDSGSVILDDETNEPVGLLFSGTGEKLDPNGHGSYCTYANHIDDVCDALGIAYFVDSL